jgi:hypothetical protein
MVHGTHLQLSFGYAKHNESSQYIASDHKDGISGTIRPVAEAENRVFLPFIFLPIVLLATDFANRCRRICVAAKRDLEFLLLGPAYSHPLPGPGL